MTTDIIAELKPTLGRRWFGVIILSAVGVLFVWIALTNPPQVWWGQGLMVLIGLFCFWQAQWNLRVTQTGLTLTRQGLFDGQGNLVAALDNMLEVDRGVFAFKPSNGFLVRLRDPEPRGWAPGLYWRLGRRLGVGGATSPAQNKVMADMITTQIMERALGPEIS